MIKKSKQDLAVDLAILHNPTLSGERTDHCVFRRSATSFETLAMARKRLEMRTLTLAQARAVCAAWNDNRSTSQIRKGTKWEFTTLAAY